MELSDITGIIAAIGVIAGGNGFVQWYVNRKDKNRQQKLDDIYEELKKINQKHTDDRHDLMKEIIKLQLYTMLTTEPDNVKDIISLAQTYFVELGGNSWMYSRYKKWAKEHDIDTTWLDTHIDNK